MTIGHCLGCGSVHLKHLIDFGSHPAANGLLTDSSQAQPVYPLAVNWCPWCSLVQLSHCVERNNIFNASYPYRSGVSKGWHEHCVALAEAHCHQGYGTPLMLDIGGNDGTAARAFWKAGYEVIVVDPAAPKAPDVRSLREFFTAEFAQRHDWKPGLILAQNVLAHTSDPLDMLYGMSLILADGGSIILECPHIYQQLANADFTQFYHEHITYWTLRALETCCARVGLYVSQAEILPNIHGGSVRYILRRAPNVERPSPAIEELRIAEQGPMTESRAYGYRSRMQRQLGYLQKKLVAPTPIWAIGASAKLSTLLSLVGPNSVAFVVDDTPEKQGKYMPTGQPILGPQNLASQDRLLIGAWNWTDALKERAQQMGFRGQYIVPFA